MRWGHFAIRLCLIVDGHFRSLQGYYLRIPFRLILVIHWNKDTTNRHSAGFVCSPTRSELSG